MKPIRSIRGWCLGNQNKMVDRRTQRSLGRDCPCTYSKPYLHSLTKTWAHWSGPVWNNLTLPESDTSSLWCDSHQDCRLLFGGDTACTTKCPGHWGGIYSYKPEFIERMGNWDHVHVLGVVTNFGRVKVHERGYRSDHMRIDRLWVLRSENVRFPLKKLQQFLETTYQADVIMLKAGIVDSFVTWLKKENVESLL